MLRLVSFGMPILFSYHHGIAATQIHSSLLSISVGAVLLPAAFHFALTYDSDDEVSASTSLELQKQSILRMSRGVRICSFFVTGDSLY